MSDLNDYTGYIRRKRLIILFLAVAALVAAFSGLCLGSAELTPGEVFSTILRKGTRRSAILIYNIRLPRIVTALVAGMGLASVGCALQSILRNPLASSSTLGISQGAAFGASFAIIVLGAGMQNQTLDGITIMNPYLVSICAFICSMFSTFIILGLSRLKKMPPESMILAGVAMSTLFGGATTLLQYFAADVKIAAVVFWTFGDLGRTSWREITVMGSIVSLSILYNVYNRWNYNALQSGEEQAKGLGLNADAMRLIGMFVCSLTAATIVSFVGIINFVGLVSPHLVRRFVGSDYRFLLPASAIMGAFLLLLSDTVARLAIAPIILPIGAITSFLGAPLFLYLLFKGGKQR